MAGAACICLVFLMLVTFVDVVGRYFNAPLTFAVELTELGMGLLVFFGLAMVTMNRGHIGVDLVESVAPDQINALLKRIASLAGVLFIGLMAWRLADRASNFMSDGLATQTLFLPVYPVVFLMAAAAGIATLVALVQLVKFRDSDDWS
jgi:TRAP-type C4-dicarboxylate transport system permease small subunit